MTILFLSILASFLSTISIWIIGLAALGIKAEPKKIFIFGAFGSVFYYFIHPEFLPFGIHTISRIIFITILCYLVFRLELKICILSALIGICINMLCYILFGTICSHLYNCLDLNFINYISSYNAISLFNSVCLILISLLVMKSGFKLLPFDLNTNANIAQINIIREAFPLTCLLVSQAIIVMLLYSGNFAEAHIPILSKSLLTFSHAAILLIAALAIFAVFMMKKVIYTIQNEYNLKSKVESIQYVEDLIKKIRIQHHDYKHHIQVISGLLQVKEYQEALNYINTSVESYDGYSELIKIGNISLSALLYIKMGIAKKNNIYFDFEFDIDLSKIPIEEKDLIVILGNLIDNAIESQNENINGKRHIHLTISQNTDGYLIRIYSTGKLIDYNEMKKIFDFGFSTKKDGKGIGLPSIKNILDNYNGKIDVTSNASTGNCFSIVIPY